MRMRCRQNREARPTRAKGIPVGVKKAGSNLCPRSCANRNSSPRYHDKWNGWLGFDAKRWPDRSPPSTRMVVSNTWGLVFESNDTQSITSLTAFSKPLLSLRITNVSNVSTRVTEKFPETSLYAKLCLHYAWDIFKPFENDSRIGPIRTSASAR